VNIWIEWFEEGNSPPTPVNLREMDESTSLQYNSLRYRLNLAQEQGDSVGTLLLFIQSL
jgi:hypothetical protein